MQLGENLGGVEFPWAISRLKENSQAPDKPIIHMMNMVQITNRKDVITMKKPTYYLWRNDFSTQEEYKAAKERFERIGFRVVTYLDGNPDQDIHTGIKALVRNHWKENIPIS